MSKLVSAVEAQSVSAEMSRFYHDPYEVRYERGLRREAEDRLSRMTKLKEKWHKKAKELEAVNKDLEDCVARCLCGCDGVPDDE